MELGIVAQRGNDRAAALASVLLDHLRERGVGVRLDAATATALDEEAAGAAVETFDRTDLVVSVGGDGTFLFAARAVGDTPILGVNLGEVGFLNAIGPDEAVDAVLAQVDAIENGRLATREMPRIAPRGDGWTGDPATNEVVITGPRRGHGGGVGIEVRIDGSLYTGGPADGVLVATPTGSTAYNLSERGPLVHHGVSALVVTEMCAADGMPPLVVGADSEVRVTVTDADEAVVVSDGRAVRSVSPPTDVRLATTDPPVRIAGPTASFFEALGKLD
jgi:NAD+ kinase